MKGLFLNAAPGFDSTIFTAACAKKDIIANVKENPRNSANAEPSTHENGTHVFDTEQLHADRSVIEPHRRIDANAWIDGFKARLYGLSFQSKTG